MSTLIQETGDRRQATAPATQRKAGHYALFTARALVRCTEMRLRFLRQCEGGLFSSGRAETVLLELHRRRAALAELTTTLSPATREQPLGPTKAAPDPCLIQILPLPLSP